MRQFGLGAIVVGALIGSFAYACGSMQEIAPGVFQGTGKYEGTYRLAQPGEAADVTVTTFNPNATGGAIGGFGRGFIDGGSLERTGYVKLTPSDLANMSEAEKAEAAAQSKAAIPQPPPMYRVSPSQLKLKVELPKEAKPEKAARKADEEDLILI